MSPSLSPIANVAEKAPAPKLPISPLVGEMPGRAEEGAKELYEWCGRSPPHPQTISATNPAMPTTSRHQPNSA